MSTIKAERLKWHASLKKDLVEFSSNQIEEGVMLFCLFKYGRNVEEYVNHESKQVAAILEKSGFLADIETIIELFETLLEDDNKAENGIVFTPQYIADYIAKSVFEGLEKYDSNLAILDPGCGCGIFLVSATEYLRKKFALNVDTIIENHIFGMDIDKNNVHRCELVLKLVSAKYGGNFSKIKTNLICRDSLKCSWSAEFGLDSFTYIMGNPPYVNAHSMNKKTVKYLKNTFSTTKSGVFNIFYAFIEYAMKFLDDDGMLGYIVPNNFLTIKSAMKLRDYLQENRLIKKILDFGDNMVFKPIRTYNCILLLSKQAGDSFEYCVMPKTDDMEKELKAVHFQEMFVDNLDKNGWKLVDEVTFRNLRKIESQFIPIKEFIRTGIATLSDNVFFVDYDNQGYYKRIGSEKIYIEKGLIKPIYKIPELKLHDNVDEAKRYIIFPYIKSDSGYTLIQEEAFKTQYPKTYECLYRQRIELDSRDKGKGAAQGWYAYGRTQGLNKYGEKLLFPTFANKPQFTYIKNEDTLFCNGYAVFENDTYELELLQKILNSRLMDYYVSHTSYSIEGGYYCYQKKYVGQFSLPYFSADDIEFIYRASENELNAFLWKTYHLEGGSDILRGIY